MSYRSLNFEPLVKYLRKTDFRFSADANNHIAVEGYGYYITIWRDVYEIRQLRIRVESECRRNSICYISKDIAKVLKILIGVKEFGTN